MRYGDRRSQPESKPKVKTLFHKNRTPLALEGFYTGQSIFLICNGPSVDDMNLIPLDTRQTFGINNGGILRPKFWTAQDPSAKFSDAIWLDPTIIKFVAFSHNKGRFWDTTNLCESKLMVRDCPSVIFHPKSSSCDPDTWLTEDSICWGVPKGKDGHRVNTMMAALHIVYKLGFRTVYIIGADFTMSPDEPYFFEEEGGQGKAKSNNELYRLTNDYLSRLDPLWQEAGYNVYNCTDGGDLNSLRRMEYIDALKATEINTTRETLGLYRGIDEKVVKHMTKGILYYSHNTLDGTKLNDACRDSLIASGLPITSVTHKPIDFGTNIVVDRLPSLLAMLENIVDGLEAMTEDYIFLAEHDCLYNNSHFDVKLNKLQFNINAWRVGPVGYYKHKNESPVLSTLSGPRKDILRVMTAKRNSYRIAHSRLNVRRRAYAPTIFEPRGQGSIYGSLEPVLDFRHQRNTTMGGLPRRSAHVKTLKPWGHVIDLVHKLEIRPHTPNVVPHIRQLLGKYRNVMVVGGTQRHADFIKTVFDMDDVKWSLSLGDVPKDWCIVIVDGTAKEDGRTIFIPSNVFKGHPRW